MSQTTMPSLCHEATQQDPAILSEEVGCESSSCPLVDSKGREIRKCPRCDSINTKFCYYNNQRVAQPRHFCKSCRRYWTHGGSLRDVPIGGASRTNKPKPSPQNGTIEEENKRPFSSSSTHSNEEVKDIIPSFFDPIFASDSASTFGDGVNSLIGDELPLLGGSAASSGFMNLLLSGGVERSEAFSFGTHYSFSQLLNPSDTFDAPEITLSEEVGIFEGL